jgi:hypothetical protein
MVSRSTAVRRASVLALAAMFLAGGRANAAPGQPWVVRDVVDEYGQVFVVCATGVTATTRRHHFNGDVGGQAFCAPEKRH